MLPIRSVGCLESCYRDALLDDSVTIGAFLTKGRGGGLYLCDSATEDLVSMAFQSIIIMQLLLPYLPSFSTYCCFCSPFGLLLVSLTLLFLFLFGPERRKAYSQVGACIESRRESERGEPM